MKATKNVALNYILDRLTILATISAAVEVSPKSLDVLRGHLCRRTVTWLLIGMGFLALCPSTRAADSPLLTIDSINFSSAHCANSAVRLRVNESTPLPYPQWQNNNNSATPCSIAYGTTADKANDVAISVTLHAPSGTYWGVVRAILVAGESDAILGGVPPVAVYADHSPSVVFCPLADAHLKGAGIGVHNVVWQWQYAAQRSGPWTDFQITRQRVYTLLTRPTLPWLPDTESSTIADNPNFVWTDVLNWSCRWANGTHTTDEAAAAITQAVYDLGREKVNGTPRLTYGESGYRAFSDSYYLSLPSNEVHLNRFFCTRFLRFLNDPGATGQIANCFDCASIVTTFSNAVGCDLSEVTLAPKESRLPTKPVLVIGATDFRAWIGDDSWVLHSVAWEGPLTEAGKVFDACLALDDRGGNGFGSHKDIVAKGMHFGSPVDKQGYLYRLAAKPDTVTVTDPIRRIVSKPIIANR